MHSDRLVHLVARDAQRRAGHDASEGNDRDLGGSAADVYDHRAGRLGDGKIRTHSGGHGLLDKVGLACARLNRRFENSALLDGSGAARNADDDARLGLPRVTALYRFIDEGGKHGLGHVVVGDDAVAQGMLCRKCIGSMVDHLLGFMTDGQNAMRTALDRHDARLVQHNTLPRYGNKRICGAKVNSEVARRGAPETPEQVADEIHERHRECPFPFRFLYFSRVHIRMLYVQTDILTHGKMPSEEYRRHIHNVTIIFSARTRGLTDGCSMPCSHRSPLRHGRRRLWMPRFPHSGRRAPLCSRSACRSPWWRC